MDIQRLESRLVGIVIKNLNWQDLFQAKIGMLNEPISKEEFEKIKEVGLLRYRNDALFNQRVRSLTTNIIAEVIKTIEEESL
jgi:hypothetical protein